MSPPAPGPDRYAVFGHPISHSLSPFIQTRFAAQMGEVIEYTTIDTPPGEFASHAHAFFASGARGANVSLPFKVDAFRFAKHVSERATLAGAANFLVARDGAIDADNTDGVGLVNDLQANHGAALGGARILILGAGGAVRGVVAPLLACGPKSLMVANRTRARAAQLRSQFADLGPIDACGLESVAGAYDLVINATSASTRGESLAIPAGIFAPGALAYDMAYGPKAKPFVEGALRAGAARACDGLGMLVEQAAESYALWRGKRPATAAVLAELRARS